MDDLQISDGQVLERLRRVKMGRKKNKRLAFRVGQAASEVG